MKITPLVKDSGLNTPENAVLIQSDRAVTMNPNNSSTGVNIHVVFDNCSQRSYHF